MKIKAGETNGQLYQIWINGVEVNHVYEADDEEGYVITRKRGPNGELCFVNDEIATETMHGNVTICPVGLPLVQMTRVEDARRRACVEALELEVRKLRHAIPLNDATWRNQLLGVQLRLQSIMQEHDNEQRG